MGRYASSGPFLRYSGNNCSQKAQAKELFSLKSDYFSYIDT